MKKCSWGKTISFVLFAMIILLLPSKKVNAAENSKEELRIVFETMNKMEAGQRKLVNNKWLIECREETTYSPQKTYSDSKKKSKIFTVKRGKNQVNAFTIKQSVSYKINETEKTVSIQSYSTSGLSHLSDYTVTKTEGDYYTKDFLPEISMGNAVYDIYSDRDGTLRVAPFVTVKATGKVKFKFDVV